jgi:hypothetical protein
VTINGDLLSASSLLVAVLTYFSSQVLPATAVVLGRPVPKFSPDRGPLIAETKAALVGQAAPLAMASLAVAAALLPPSLGVVKQAIDAVGGSWRYAPLGACFLLVEIFLLALAAAVIRRVFTLGRRLRQLRVERQPGAGQ